MSLYLDPKTVPNGSGLPISLQELINVVSQYTSVEGLGNLGGVNYGATTPATEDRDKPWLKLDNDGFSLGWWFFEGSSWKPVKKIGVIEYLGHDVVTAPVGYRVCNGSGTYTDEDGNIHNIPDLRDNVLMGSGNTYTTGDTVGEDSPAISLDLPATTGSKQLEEGEIPDHTHKFAFVSNLTGFTDEGAAGLTGENVGRPSGGGNHNNRQFSTIHGGDTPTASAAGASFTMPLEGNATGTIDVRQKSFAAPAIIWVAS